MTKLELIDAYVRGRIDRRHFVRQLTAFGVSAGAALAYAQSLAPTAAAAGSSRSPAGFVVRAQEDDEVYGTVCSIDSDLEALLALMPDTISVPPLIDAGLSLFGDADFPALGDTAMTAGELLQVLRDESQEHANVIETELAERGSTVAEATIPSVTTVSAFLGALTISLKQLAGIYAGVVPIIVDDELRQTLTSIAIVIGRHAAIANLLLGESPFVGPFEQPICP